MQVIGKTNAKVLNAIIFVVFLFLFGTVQGSFAAPAPAATYQIVPTPTSLSFTGKVGTTPACQSLIVYANPATALPVALAGSASWITVTPTSGNTKVYPIPSVCLNTTGFSAGTYTGSVVIVAPNGNGSNSPLNVPVTLTLTAGTTSTYQIVPTPASLSFSGAVGSTPACQSMSVWASPATALSVTLGTNAAWLSVTPTSGVTNVYPRPSVCVNTTGLAAGTYSGNVVLTAPNGTGSNSPLNVPVTLTVTGAAAVAPSITSQPASQTVTMGQSATFNVAATGTSPMTYQWMMNSTAISGATSSTYTTPSTTSSYNAAKFSVALSNAAGSVTSAAATLTVNNSATAPSITTQPAAKSILAGQTATFSVAATGTSPMTYQWMMNGSAISGATSSTYTTPAETTSANNAQFTAMVSNSAGSATSSAAVLTVGADTLLLNPSVSSLNFGSVNESMTSSQTVTLTNAGNSNVTISGVSISGAGFNASGVASGLTLTPGQSTTLTATFTPSSTGSITGQVTVASNATNSPDSISLSGTGVAAVNHSAALSWTASTSSVAGYNTYSSTTSGGPYTKLTSSPNPGTSYTDTTVQAGKTYYYVVTSVDSSDNESGYSSQVTAIIP